MTWSQNLATFSRMIDDHAVSEGPNHLLRIRCSKIAEEMGEVEEVLIAMEGSNPRKPRVSDNDYLIKELLDVASAALGAIEHVTGNVGASERLFESHCDALLRRMQATLFPQEES